MLNLKHKTHSNQSKQSKAKERAIKAFCFHKTKRLNPPSDTMPGKWVDLHGYGLVLTDWIVTRFHSLLTQNLNWPWLVGMRRAG